MKKLCTFLILILIFKSSSTMESKKIEHFNLDEWVKRHGLSKKNCKLHSLTQQQLNELTNSMQSVLSNKSQTYKDGVVEKIWQRYPEQNTPYEFRQALIKGAALAGAQINSDQDNQHYTRFLGEAALCNDLEFAQFLLKYRANPNNILSGQILVYANSVEMAQLFLTHGAQAATAQDEDGNNLIHREIMRNAPLELLRLYLEHGVDPNQKKSRDGNTPLHVLAYDNTTDQLSERNLKTAEILLKYGASIAISNNKNYSPAHFAFALAKGIEKFEKEYKDQYCEQFLKMI